MIFISIHSLMNTHKYTLRIILAGIFLSLIAETAMAFFFNKVLEANEFLEVLNELPQGAISDRQIKRTTLENQELPDQPLENTHFKSCKWNNLDAHDNELKNIIFEDCEFNSINMRNANLNNVQFINSTLTNVVMNNATLTQVKFIKSELVSTDPNIDNSYNGLIADELLFKNSKLTSIGFFEAKGIFRFEESTLYDVSGAGLLAGSALFFHKIQGSILDFRRSNLTDLEIIDSKIDKRSSAGGGSINNIRVENSELEFSLGDNSNIESALFENSGDVVVGGGKNNKEVLVKDCPKDTFWLDVGGENFGSVVIENCHVADLAFSSSSGSKITIKNSSANVLDFRKSSIEHLILDNVKVTQKIKYHKTNIQNFESKNISFGKNIKVWNEDSNIEINPDKILDE